MWRMCSELIQTGRLRFFLQFNPTKVIGNILHCLNQGSRLGWLIDPDQRSLFVYPSRQQPEWYTESAEKLPVPNLVAEFQLTLGNLWGWLKL